MYVNIKGVEIRKISSKTTIILPITFRLENALSNRTIHIYVYQLVTYRQKYIKLILKLNKNTTLLVYAGTSYTDIFLCWHLLMLKLYNAWQGQGPAEIMVVIPAFVRNFQIVWWKHSKDVEITVKTCWGRRKEGFLRYKKNELTYEG